MLKDIPHLPCNKELVAELFYLDLKPSALCRFIRGSKEVAKLLASLQGYVGMEIFVLSENRAMLLVKWENFLLFEQFLPCILRVTAAAQWNNAVQACTHQPAIVQVIAPG